jgi:hypothetical protein
LVALELAIRKLPAEQQASCGLTEVLSGERTAPEFIITLTREGSPLFVQATGQPEPEVFPENARDYFLKVVDAQITFEADS